MERGKKGIHSWEKDIKRKEFVLDIGCWNGKRIQSLLGKCRPYGLEIDEKKINLASPKIKKRIFLGDITKKETLNKVIKKKFDRIFLGEVLEHLEEDELALKNINFLLKKGGKLIITTPKSTPFLEFIDPAWILWKLRLGERHHHYAQKEIEEKLKRNGFKIKEEFLMKEIMKNHVIIKGFEKYYERTN